MRRADQDYQAAAGTENDVEMGQTPTVKKQTTIDLMKDDEHVTEVNDRKPQRVTCPQCQFSGMTTVKKEKTKCGKIMCIVLAFCLLCCCASCSRCSKKYVHRC